MATRSKKRTTQAAKSPSGESNTKPMPQDHTQGQNENPATIRKGIYLSALIYIEGDQAPADNFLNLAKSALTAALANNQTGLTMTLKKVQEQTDIEDEIDQQDKANKFEF